MSWTVLVATGLVVYAMKAAGPVLAGERELPARVGQVLDLVAVPLLAGLVAVQTLDGGHRIVIDARVPAVLVAALLVRRGAPFLVVVLAASATAALLRLAF